MATWGNVSGPWRLSIGDNEPGLHPILSFLTFLVPPPKQNPEYLPLVPISNYQPFTHVPNEILCEIASFLPVRDFTSFICTSKRHGQLDKEDSIWKGLCMRDFGAENVRNSIFTHFNKNWKWVYQSKKIVFKSRKSIKDGSVGTYLSKKGRCEGEWKGKRLHGYGILYAEETGNIIEGEWVNGVGHGFTRLIYKSGDVYAGQWQNGVLEGHGICYFAQGSIYKGQWKDNHVHGEGTCWFPDGRYHKGQWVAGEKHGEGVCTFADGHQFKAKWKHNKPGKGTLICPKTGIALKTHWTREFACCSKAGGIN